MYEPDFDINIGVTNLKLKDKLELTLIENKSTFFKDILLELSIKFKSKNDLEEFCYFFNKMKAKEL